MPRYTLYSYFRSSASWRVRSALALKGVPYTYAPIHLLEGGGQQFGATYRALNPMSELPALAIHEGDHLVAVLAQSVAILEYLEEQHPEPALLPPDPIGRARVRQLVECVNSSIQPVQNLKVLLKVEQDFGADKLAWGRFWIERGFDGLEQLVAASAGAHAYGDSVTLADVAIVPQVFNARRFQCDMARYPTLARVAAAAEALDAFRAAAPDQQPDHAG